MANTKKKYKNTNAPTTILKAATHIWFTSIQSYKLKHANGNAIGTHEKINHTHTQWTWKIEFESEYKYRTDKSEYRHKSDICENMMPWTFDVRLSVSLCVIVWCEACEALWQAGQEQCYVPGERWGLISRLGGQPPLCELDVCRINLWMPASYEMLEVPPPLKSQRGNFYPGYRRQGNNFVPGL